MGGSAAWQPEQRVVHLRGIIASSGFASGDRFVAGCWTDGPLGPMVDVMWARPDGERVLLVADATVAAMVQSVYAFDRVELGELRELEASPREVHVGLGPLELELRGGRPVRLPAPRPAWVTRFVEAPVARALMGVRTYGTSPTGVREWYRASGWSWVREGSARLDGRDLGPIAPLDPPCGFGFSESPRRPSIVTVQPRLAYPSGSTAR